MSIFDAMYEQQHTNGAAMLYWKAGLSVIPLSGKKPGVKSWKDYTQRRPNETQIRVWQRQGAFKNIGIVCGQVSGGLVIVDLDGLDAVARFYKLFPHLTKTLTVISGSRKGRHLYFWCQNTSTVRMKGIEVRGDGCYMVAPPSIHPDSGHRYALHSGHRVQRIELTEVRGWIKAQRHQTSARPTQAKHEVRKAAVWAEAALSGELRTLLQTGEGAFNNALYRAALKMGSVVAAGHLDQIRVENALYATARQCGYVSRDGHTQTIATIASGLQNGMRNPRERKQA